MSDELRNAIETDAYEFTDYENFDSSRIYIEREDTEDEL